MIIPDKPLDDMSIEELRADNFKLSAYQCHNPLSDEYGHMLCADVEYWRKRCLLAEAYGKCSKNDYEQNRNAYQQFIDNNKQP